MLQTRARAVMIFALVCSNAGFACDPAAPNWQAFYKANDKNNDKKLQRSEWQHLDFTGSYYDAGFESTLPPQQIFTQMDHNKNNVIDGDEIYDLWSYLHNPCADFDRRNDSASERKNTFWLDEIKSFLQQLF
jgi:hypothetical protein